MRLASSSIVAGRIQQVHACRAKGGSDQTPHLDIQEIPSEGRYIAVVADDPDAMKPAGKVWVHWNVFNVPAQGDLDIAAGQQLAGEAGTTSGGGRGYEGMCPPDGMHTYRFAVFAFASPVQVDTRTAWTIDAFEKSYGAQAIGKAQITGTFQ